MIKGRTSALALALALVGCSTFGEESAADAAAPDVPPGCQAPACAPITTGLKGTVDHIAATDTEVIFMLSPGGIFACPLAGCTGAPRQIVAVERPRHLVLHKGIAYWFDEESGEVRGVPAAGGSPFLVTSGLAVVGLAAHPNFLRIANGGEIVARCALSGGSCSNLNFTSSGPLAGDGTFVYWPASGSVYSIDETMSYATPEMRIGTGAGAPRAIFAASGSAYVLEVSGNVMQYSRTGAAAGVSVAAAIGSAVDLTVIGDKVYVAASSGEVVALGPNGTRTLVAKGLASPKALAARGSALYVGVTGGVVRFER